MISSPTCNACGAVLEAGDRYCPACGRAAAPPASDQTSPTAPEQCPFCGKPAGTEAGTCRSCGATIAAAAAARPAPSSEGRRSLPAGIGWFASWKITAAVAAALAAVVILAAAGHNAGGGAGGGAGADAGDPHDHEMLRKVRELQSRIESSPEDSEALLEYANLLYDIRLFERAAHLYERHLALLPGNVDARVDLGTSYFQMSMHDSARAGELLSRAETCFVRAIRERPKHQLAHFNLGILLLHRGDLPGAAEWLRKSIDIDPGSEAARRAKSLLTDHLPTNPS